MRIVEGRHGLSERYVHYIFNEPPAIDRHIFNEPNSTLRTQFLKHPLMHFKRLINYSIMRIQWATKAIHVSSYPYSLIVDSGNICTLSCPWCPTGRRDTSRPRGFLRFADLKKLIDEIGDAISWIQLSNWGEPFLNKDILSMVTYCKQKGIPKTGLASCLVPIINYERLCLSGLDKLEVAISGASQHTYEKRMGGDFDKAISNLKALVSKRKELGRKTPYITWNFLVFRDNEHELGKALKIAKDIGVDRIRFVGANVAADACMTMRPLAENIEMSTDLVGLGTRFSHFTKEGKPKYPKTSCDLLWRRCAVSWDGSVFPCYMYCSQKYNLGNCFEKSFKEIWNNETYREARKIVRKSLKQEFSIEEYDKILCAICTYYGRYRYRYWD